MPLTRLPLPYDLNSLEPYMSAQTLSVHYGKHHKAYVDNMAAAIKGTPLENAELESIVKTAKETGDRYLFNNSAQAWNHDFFWKSMTPDKAAKPEGRLLERLISDFGGIDHFKEKFKAEAVGHFASGWTWLILWNGKLQVTSYHDADTPIIHDGAVPLLTVDVWEHAYYLDHQNARANFLSAFLDHLVNWKGAEERLARAML